MFLLDTNVVSELRKVSVGTADRGLSQWALSVDPETLYLSVVSVQEIETGILLKSRRDPLQGAMLRRWLMERVLPTFEGRILPVDLTVALRSAALHVPTPRPTHDALIAATALVHRLTVVTHNVADFVSTGVPLLNPGEPR